ncbi:MAG: nitrite reductase small subunit NirD [Proteobacteria bacterium]|nr:nitrite reductase small subunit NirD [Pseudomonadota bacterium]MDE3208541.1 nitrite reductase small subunit NirD [Pseudomonadota bacterium]
MNNESTGWIAAGQLADIPKSGARCFIHANHRVALFRTHDDGVYALEDRCPHRGGPLSEGMVWGNCVTCPLHGLVIDLADGKAQVPDDGNVPTYPVRIEKGTVLIRFPIL